MKSTTILTFFCQRYVDDDRLVESYIDLCDVHTEQVDKKMS